MAGEIQMLDARYIDGAKLVQLLTELFGEGNFSFDVGTRLLSDDYS